MQELVGIGHLVVIADAVLEQRLLEAFLKLGAKGYNCHYCMGKGRHEILEDPFTGRSRVRIAACICSCCRRAPPIRRGRKSRTTARS